MKGQYDTAHPRVQAIEESREGKGNGSLCNARGTYIPEEVNENGKAHTIEEWLSESIRAVRNLKELERQLNEIAKPDPVQDTMERRELPTH